MESRHLAIGFGLLLLLSACSGDGASLSDTQVAEASPSPSASVPGHGSGPAGKGPSGNSRDTEARETGSDSISPGEGSGEGAQASSPEVDPSGGGTAGKKPNRAPYPAPGEYVYAQDGYEEFCSGPSCDRSELARRQTVSAELTGQPSSGKEITTEIRGEGDRVMRTTTLYSPAGAAVTSVYVRLGYQGFVFENDYAPDPPVEIIRLPIREGTGWTGGWKADTSGSYEARVAGLDTVMVGGRAVDAFRIVASVTYRGEFRGTSDTQIWVDPKSLAVLKTSGLLRLTSNFGGYNTAWQTHLVSGPRF